MSEAIAIERTPVQIEWSRCRPWIEAAVARSPFGLEDIEDVELAINERRYLFFAGQRCACVVEVQQYPKRKVLCVVHGGGDLNELAGPMEQMLSDFAREIGCDLMAGIGRKGWERVTEKIGYRFGFVTMFKALRQ